MTATKELNNSAIATLPDAENRRHVEEEEEEEVECVTPEPPDGGWGWMVVFCSFMIHVIADGVTYTFGIFHMEFLRYFGESNEATAWVSSIMVGTTHCIGPFASGLMNQFGCRTVTIIGSLFATFGLIMSTIAPSVTFLYFSAGLCTDSSNVVSKNVHSKHCYNVYFLKEKLILPGKIAVRCVDANRGTYVSLTSVILVDLLGLDKLTNAFGLLLLFEGLGCFIGSPITGWLHDYTGSYDPGFYLSGAMIAVSGLMLFYIPCVQRYFQKKHAKQHVDIVLSLTSFQSHAFESPIKAPV